MNILVSSFDDVIVDAGREYVQYVDKVETFNNGVKGPIYGTLNINNSIIAEVPDFIYNQSTDGGRYRYVDGQIVEV